MRADGTVTRVCEHGTRACYLRGCRRAECREANRLYGWTYRHRGRRVRDAEGWDTLTGMDVSDVIDEIGRLLHMG